MSKIDYRKVLKDLYNPPAKSCSVVDVPPMNFIMTDGAGDPNSSSRFQAAVEALFSVSYTLKFMSRNNGGTDYGVMPLEGLWWCPDMRAFSIDRKEDWLWTLMIMQPVPFSQDLYESAIEKVKKDKKAVSLDQLRLGEYDEGLSAQIMHTGPFSGEGSTVVRLHAFIAQGGYRHNGKHHEIYLSDIRRADQKNWKTVIRQPIS